MIGRDRAPGGWGLGVDFWGQKLHNVENPLIFAKSWREAHIHALACDVWFDLETRHLHLENLYRIKVPTA